MSAYNANLTFSRPSTTPRVILNIATVLDGAVPVTRIKNKTTNSTLNGTSGRVLLVEDRENYSAFQVGDAVKISGITDDLPVTLNGKTLQIVKVTTSEFLTEYQLQDTGFRGDDYNITTGTFVVQIPFSYAEFYGFKDVTTANAGETLIGSDSATVTQPIGKGPAVSSLGNVAYAWTPANGHRDGLQDWYFKVAADGDGVKILIWP
jgi:hypothetical protein